MKDTVPFGCNSVYSGNGVGGNRFLWNVSSHLQDCNDITSQQTANLHNHHQETQISYCHLTKTYLNCIQIRAINMKYSTVLVTRLIQNVIWAGLILHQGYVPDKCHKNLNRENWTQDSHLKQGIS
jgi:hypothetical protein